MPALFSTRQVIAGQQASQCCDIRRCTPHHNIAQGCCVLLVPRSKLEAGGVGGCSCIQLAHACMRCRQPGMRLHPVRPQCDSLLRIKLCLRIPAQGLCCVKSWQSHHDDSRLSERMHLLVTAPTLEVSTVSLACTSISVYAVVSRIALQELSKVMSPGAHRSAC